MVIKYANIVMALLLLAVGICTALVTPQADANTLATRQSKLLTAPADQICALTRSVISNGIIAGVQSLGFNGSAYTSCDVIGSYAVLSFDTALPVGAGRTGLILTSRRIHLPLKALVHACPEQHTRRDHRPQRDEIIRLRLIPYLRWQDHPSPQVAAAIADIDM
ncbi:uncharacterized protein L969DRAFT_564655 [Mixia osmundae IAM 14324]|uniref:Uncharacterized protein n=1 Tax=Mixia osmundae (strain CBS 9802 / IAM 14324 / JCM 22182 / KY 12970) TaxID=764103 RepID=G7EAT7_MIXOS|nr:uncharacterized protein L969DRAFT_564655 [Mixia osmundae IAM 14324]KEI38031.1 hypothetical protein L969DRAFT_564655 [Mixia osmundae IAM 14324]GAA99947.1 hypothetical protein E5Q_06650 [Mixia osmundae IAM 14324]